MKARIVDMAEVRKTPEERQAEELLSQLSPGKAIEVTLDQDDTPKKISRLYRHTAGRLRMHVRIETLERGKKLLVSLKTGDD